MAIQSLYKNQTTARSEELGKIHEKLNNYVRYPRTQLFNFEVPEHELSKLTIPKTIIESWNFEQIINLQLEKLLQKDLSEQSMAFLNFLKEDMTSIIRDSFSISDDYRPYEFSLQFTKIVPCTKLHADFLPLRLLCTYYGPGTIFLPQGSTRYSCLNNGSPNKRVHRRETPLFQAHPFELILLKGRKFGKSELKPCAHRSPDLKEGEQRLFLKVDFK